MSDSSHDVKERHLLYRYPHHFLYTEVILFSIISMLLIFAWVPAIISIFSYGNVLGSALRAAIFLNMTAVALILLFFFVKNELQTSVFILSDSCIAHKTSTSLKKIDFSNIRSVSVIPFPLQGGMVVIESDKVRITLPLMLHKSSDLINRLIALCEIHAPNALPDATSLTTLRRSLLMASMIYKRSEAVFRPLVSTCIAMLPINLVAGAFFWDIPVIPLATWTVAGPFFPLVSYICADILIRLKERHALQHTQAEVPFSVSSNIIAKSGLLFLCLYLAAAIYYRALVY